MAEFGKRRTVSRSSATNSFEQLDIKAALRTYKRGRLPWWTRAGFFHLLLTGAFCCGALYSIAPYAIDVARDLRLSGTWVTAYDVKAHSGVCTPYAAVTLCKADFTTATDHESSQDTINFMVGFTSAKGELLIPVRSTADPSRVSIVYAAETKLLNRTITMLLVSAPFLLFLCMVVSRLVNGRYKGGPAHRRLIAGLVAIGIAADLSKSGAPLPQ